MSFLKSTEASNKAKFPIKKAKKSLKICRYCDKEITSENALFYTGGLGQKNVCLPCRRKISSDYNKKIAKRKKNNPLW